MDFKRTETTCYSTNLKRCKLKEDAFNRATDEAKAELTKLLCNKSTYMYPSSAKKMWENFSYLTTYRNDSGGGGGGVLRYHI